MASCARAGWIREWGVRGWLLYTWHTKSVEQTNTPPVGATQSLQRKFVCVLSLVHLRLWGDGINTEQHSKTFSFIESKVRRTGSTLTFHLIDRLSSSLGVLGVTCTGHVFAGQDMLFRAASPRSNMFRNLDCRSGLLLFLTADVRRLPARSLCAACFLEAPT